MEEKKPPPTPVVDMSPEAVAQRLRDLAQLYKLGMKLKHFRWLGPRQPPTDTAAEPLIK